MKFDALLFSHFDPYHAVQLKSLAEHYVTVCFLSLTFIFIIARNSLKSDYNVKMCFPEAEYTLKFVANHYLTF